MLGEAEVEHPTFLTSAQDILSPEGDPPNYAQVTKVAFLQISGKIFVCTSHIPNMSYVSYSSHLP